MRSNSVQLAKEARQLSWPWAIVTLPGLAVLAQHWLRIYPDLPRSLGPLRDPGDWVLPLGVFVGSSLLASLPLGAELQYRTLPMRFAQPIERHDLWWQKFITMLAAVVPTAVIYCLALGMREGWPFAIMAGCFVAVMTAGAIPFTLLARTTIGGMVLNMTGGTGVILSWSYYEKHGQFPPGWAWVLGAALVAYSVTMVWLGRRMMLRFQSVEGMQSGEGFVPGARFVPRVVVECFRCRDAQPLRNLVRREFHLLRTLWPLVILYWAAWIFLVAFHQSPEPRDERKLVAFALTVMLGVLIAVLAGTLSLGEEKNWGTHDWHMTMPVSVSAQWAVKLLVALSTSVFCAALLPMLVVVVGGWLRGSPSHFLAGEIAVVWIAEAAGLTLAAFWCSCVVRGTVVATMWVFPMLFGIGFATGVGDVVFRFFSQTIRTSIAGIVTWFDPMAVQRSASRLFHGVEPVIFLVFALGLMVAVGVIQTHRLFRAQVAANKLRVLICIVPLAFIAFTCAVVSDLFFSLVYESWKQETTIITEADRAFGVLAAQDRDGDKARPRRLSADDLAKASRLSDLTQHWLRGANITIASAPEHIGTGPGRYFPGRRSYFVPPGDMKDRTPYSAVIRTPNGSQCSVMYEVQNEGHVGYLTSVCQ